MGPRAPAMAQVAPNRPKYIGRSLKEIVSSVQRSCCLCPDSPHAEHIRDTDVREDDDTSTTNALNCSARDNHGHVLRQGTDQAADQEQEVGQQDDRFPAPDITNLAP